MEANQKRAIQLMYSMDESPLRFLQKPAKKDGPRSRGASEVFALPLLGAVAAGLSWSITTPLCLANQPHLLPRLHLQPLDHAKFSRTVQVVSRRGDLGDLPKAIGVLARNVLREETFGALLAAHPWIEGHLEWAEGQVSNVAKRPNCAD